jgi:hypothetical protein
MTLGRVPMMCALALLAGCAQQPPPPPAPQFEYIAPASPEARVCTAQCQVTQQMCENNAQMTVQMCEQGKRTSMDSYNACMKSGRGGCVLPPPCRADTTGCKRTYDNCFTTCGGQIKVVQPSQPAAKP